IRVRVEQRLLAHVIPGEEQGSVPAVPDGKREHPLEVLDAILPVLEVERQDDLDVRTGLERVAASLVTLPQLGTVVDLAVADELKLPVGAADRLMPAFEVDDAEPALSERNAVLENVSLVVRPSVHHGSGHAPDEVQDR